MIDHGWLDRLYVDRRLINNVESVQAICDGSISAYTIRLRARDKKQVKLLYSKYIREKEIAFEDRELGSVSKGYISKFGYQQFQGENSVVEIMVFAGESKDAIQDIMNGMREE